jgi:hypothetical protein
VRGLDTQPDATCLSSSPTTSAATPPPVAPRSVCARNCRLRGNTRRWRSCRAATGGIGMCSAVNGANRQRWSVSLNGAAVSVAASVTEAVQAATESNQPHVRAPTRSARQ